MSSEIISDEEILTILENEFKNIKSLKEYVIEQKQIMLKMPHSKAQTHGILVLNYIERVFLKHVK